LLWTFIIPFAILQIYTAKRILIVFARDMRVGENTSQPANVRDARHRWAVSALQQAAK